MATINVQFDGVDQKTIIAYFASTQDESNYPNLGTVDTSDERWAAFYSAAGGAESDLPEPVIAS
ncbi:hypothetical protein QZN20_09715 [Burkholderia multivorans]|nr:hypothetical protein [Burkholderia multivorans]